ncbi:MAG: hypothetical protein C4538_05720 [Nitrospiraceae bacterium]|nr:MAG: hypothetical protein C4538_05720 [Nitrospiraceae bacterium]
MERDIIGSVIEVEEEIRKKLEAEEKKAREWLEQVRNDAEQEIKREETSIQQDFAETIQNEKAAAEKEASETLKGVKDKAGRLDVLTDTVLNEIISRHIIMILPGEGHDSPDVKS